MSRKIVLSTVAVLVFNALCAPGTTHADIIVPGQRNIRPEVYLDPGTVADHCFRIHVVKQGDTLSGIAKQWLGSAERFAEIVRANPGIVADTLQIGAEILLPPNHLAGCPCVADDSKSTAAKVPTNWHLFVTTNVGPGGRLRRVIAGGDNAKPPNYGLTVIAVPDDKVAEFLSHRNARGSFAKESLAVAGVAKSKMTGFPRVVSDSDPAASIAVTFKITGIQDGNVALEKVSERRFDGAGKPLAAGDRFRPTPKHAALSLVFVLGAVGAVTTFRRRRGQSI